LKTLFYSTRYHKLSFYYYCYYHYYFVFVFVCTSWK